MADIRKVVKVFLASPGDLQDERRAAKLVVDEFNSLWAESLGYHIELIGWEDTVSVDGRPQATINRDLERCELFIGMMWKRWGTPPAVSGPYTSGFEEEFRTSVSSRQRCGRPEISLFFKNVEAELLRDPGDELKNVAAFKSQIIAEKAILFEKFDDIGEFEEKIRRRITRYVQQLQAQPASEIIDESRARPPDDNTPQSLPATTSRAETPFSVEGAKFLREFIAKTERNAEQEPIATAEVARFRLLASIIASQGNDTRFLGVHDANVLFENRFDLKLGLRELFGLIDSGLEHFSSENVPLWHWIIAVGGFDSKLLSAHSLVEASTQKRIGALSAMRLVSEPLPSGRPPDRKTYLDSWLSTDTPGAVKVEALRYLGDCGIAADLPAIKAELDRGEYQTTSTAVDAILGINLRDSHEKALRALYEHQPASINPSLLSTLFEDGASLSTKIVSQGLGHRSADVRRIAAKLLRERGAMDVETAERLTSDGDATVRFEALQVLASAGKLFSDDEAEKILVKLNETSAFSFLGATDKTGETCLALFREQRMIAMTDHDLELAARGELIFDRVAWFVLAERKFSIRGDELRASVDDHFKAEFHKALDQMARKFGDLPVLIERTRLLEEHSRKNLTRKGLDVICRRGDPQDLDRVRGILKSGFVGHSDADVEYLRKFGEWDDIPLIVASVVRADSGRTGLLLSVSDHAKYRTAAQAIYSMGWTRLGELLALPAPSRLLLHLIVESSNKEFRALSNTSITPLLQSAHDDVRKAAALKCVRAFSKGRLRQLLNDYVSDGVDQYYNVTHWLDFGISIPKNRAVPAAERLLATLKQG